ncbi:hypothetical protein BGZ52_009296 [Haplosporangium bisporale]|nr:hypothetical protein BGZ52_009296 [Haplosporangium bisporale]
MDSLPSKSSSITLRDITADNWEHIIRLVVNKDQLALVPSNFHSLCDHQFVSGSYVRAVYANETPVGYIRVNVNTQQHGLVQCFMIHQACQGLLFGTRAMALLQLELENQGVATLTVNTKPFETVPLEDSPAHFFTALGFQLGNKEHQLVCELKRTDLSTKYRN